MQKRFEQNVRDLFPQALTFFHPGSPGEMRTFAWGCVTFRDYDIEIEGLKRETMKAQEEHEVLIAVRDRLESGRAFVEEQLAKTKVWYLL